MKQLLIGIGWFLIGALVLFGGPWRAGRAFLSTGTDAIVPAAAGRSTPVVFLPGKGFPAVSSTPDSARLAPGSGGGAVEASALPSVASVGRTSSAIHRGHVRHVALTERDGARDRFSWAADRHSAVLRARVVQSP